MTDDMCVIDHAMVLHVPTNGACSGKSQGVNKESHLHASGALQQSQGLALCFIYSANIYYKQNMWQRLASLQRKNCQTGTISATEEELAVVKAVKSTWNHSWQTLTKWRHEAMKVKDSGMLA